MKNMLDSELELRRKLAATPGLTRAQRDAIVSPGNTLGFAQTLIKALRVTAAARFEEAEKAMARAFGKTEIVSTGVTNVGARQIFSQGLEVPRV